MKHTAFEIAALDFKKMGGLLPFVLQHAYTKDVLMVGFLNEEAYAKTCQSGILTIFRRGLGRIWSLGEDDGIEIRVTRMIVDCDYDTVLIETIPPKPICGHGYLSCFCHESAAKDLTIPVGQ